MIRRGRASHEAGQALPEFALVAPLFFLILFGIIQMGLLFAGQNGLTNAAREAARYASTLPTPDPLVAGNCNLAGTNAQLAYQRLTGFSMRQYVPAFVSGNVVQGTPAGLANCGTWAMAGSGTGIAYCAKDNGDTPTTYSIRVRVAIVYRHPLFIPLVGRLISSTNTWQLGATEEMRVEAPNRLINGGFAACP